MTSKQTPPFRAEHVGSLLPIPQVAEMSAPIVDHDSRTQGILQPCELARVENQIIAVGLRVVVGILAQGGTDDVEAAVLDQRCRTRIRPMLQIIGREHLREIF